MACYLNTRKGKVPVNVIIDSGSNTSNIDISLIKELGLKPSTEDFERSVRYVSTQVSFQTAGYDLEFISEDGNNSQSVRAFRVENFSSNVPDWKEICKHHRYLEDIPVLETPTKIAKILLGTDCIGLFEPLECRNAKNGGPTAIKNILGWSFLGQYTPNVLAKNLPKCFKQVVVDQKTEKVHKQKSYDSELYDLVKRSMELEDWDLQESDRPLSKKFKGGPKPVERWTEEEHIAFDKMELTHVKENNKSYTVSRIPWKEGYKEKLKNNFEAVKKRQDATLNPKSLEKKGIKLEQIQAIFDGYIEKEYIKEIPQDQWGEGWYLPFFCVVNLAKTTPIRPVFDAKAQFNRVSLNNQILNTPNLLNDTWPTLLHLRQFKYAMTGDISEMFLRIRLHEEDQKYHRFYFNGKVYQWTRILFGNTSSPNISQKVIRDICDKYEHIYPVAVKYIRKWCYMDDAIASSPTEEEIKLLAEQLPPLLMKADMRMAKFYTNSKAVIMSIPEELRSKEIQIFSDKDVVFDQSKVLGMVWDAKDDFLKYKSKFKTVEEWKSFLKIESWTKRTILKTTASTYDPLGFLSALTVQARAVIQKLWLLDLGWDEKIPQENELEWENALRNLLEIDQVKIPRWIGLAPEKDSELHIFCDASESVYCVSAYCRVKPVGGPPEVNLITAKARVTPLKNESISRLELMACVLGTRMARAIAEVYETPKENIHYWTDSANALFWINTPPKKVKVYVQNRVGEIQRTTDPCQWHHVKSEENPADIPTRTISTEELVDSKLWWTGPDFLKSEDTYPVFIPSTPTEEALKEVKEDYPLYFNVEKLGHSTGKLKNGFERSIRIFTIVVKIIQCFFKKDPKRWILASEYRAKALEYFIKVSQHKSFESEIEILRKNPNATLPRKSHLYRLNPFLDEKGILRTRTRLYLLKNVDFDQACPIILRGKCFLAKSLLEDYHLKFMHPVSLDCMLAQLHKKYYFINFNFAINNIIRNCLRCRKVAAKQQPQLMAPIKRNFQELRPFFETGIDFAGPFSIKVGRGKVRKQMFVLVLTCMNTRCTHFELCEDQKTSSVLSALTRFSCLRGAPTIIKSDNQTSFVSTSKELTDFIVDLDFTTIVEETQKEFGTQTRWEFIPPRAPHFGGSWEIMVKAMKRGVEELTEGQDVSEDQFRTILSKVSSLLNSRPLVRTFLQNREIILTPNTFLIGNFTTELNTEKILQNQNRLTAKYVEILTIENEIWKHFIKNILPEISPRTKWYKIFPPLKVGDIVLVIEDGTPRGQWKMASVQGLKHSIDGVVRSATIKMNGKLFDRPVINLFPLFDQTN